MYGSKKAIRATWFLPPAAFIWAALMTAASDWNLVFAIVFGLIAIPLGRWVDRENFEHDRTW